jgi:DNA-binding MarR family transcriptional regulator
MTIRNLKDLPTDYALVLQQICETGSDEVGVLSETLNLSQSRVLHIVASLRQKGLVMIDKTTWGDAWVRLSAKGHKLVTQLWPEAMAQPALS